MRPSIYYLLFVATIVRLDAFHCAEASTGDLLNRRELQKEPQQAPPQPPSIPNKPAIPQQAQTDPNVTSKPTLQKQPSEAEQQSSPLPPIQPRQNPTPINQLNNEQIPLEEPTRPRQAEKKSLFGARRRPQLKNRQNEKHSGANWAIGVAEARSYESVIDESDDWEPHDDKQTHPIYNPPFSSHNDPNPNEDLNSKMDSNSNEEKLLDEEDPVDENEEPTAEESSHEESVTPVSITKKIEPGPTSSPANPQIAKSAVANGEGPNLQTKDERVKSDSHSKESAVIEIDVSAGSDKTNTDKAPTSETNNTDHKSSAIARETETPEEVDQPSVNVKPGETSDANPKLANITQSSSPTNELVTDSPVTEIPESTTIQSQDISTKTTIAQSTNEPVNGQETTTQMTTTTTQASATETLTESFAPTTQLAPSKIPTDATSRRSAGTEEPPSTTTATPQDSQTERPTESPHHSRLNKEDRLSMKSDHVDEDESEPFNITDYIPVYEFKEGQLELMIWYTIFCVIALSCITFFMSIFTGSPQLSTKEAHVPEASELKQKVEAKRQSLEKEKKNMNLEPKVDLQEHQKHLEARKIKLAKLLEEKKKLAPVKRELGELTAKLGEDVDSKIAAKKQYVECLKRYKELNEESERVQQQLKEKTTRAKHEQLTMIRNFVKLEDLQDLMRGMEFKQRCMAQENSTLAMKVEANLIAEILDLKRSCNRKLAEQYKSTRRELEEQQNLESELAKELKALREECEMLECDNSIDDWRQRVADLVAEADRHYKDYLVSYYKLNPPQ